MCIIFTRAHVEWLNEHTHAEEIKVNLMENARNNLGQLNWTLPTLHPDGIHSGSACHYFNDYDLVFVLNIPTY